MVLFDDIKYKDIIDIRSCRMNLEYVFNKRNGCIIKLYG